MYINEIIKKHLPIINQKFLRVTIKTTYCQNIINYFINNINELAKYQNDKDIFPILENYSRVIAKLKVKQVSYRTTVYDCYHQNLYL